MAIKNITITQGFIISGLMNLTVLIFSRFFTNSTITEFDPVVMSNFGLLMIVLWGLAYISIAKNYHQLKWLIAIFAVEKFIYGYVWINWILNNTISDVYKKDIMAGIFYSIYGINDWIFFVFFLLVFVKTFKTPNSLGNAE
ncbi:hypothetical protein [Flavobacterium degerlachei]|jgi:hypothetical protein|uniref:Uncharacterized protein n=1 Tax=Flavobacterium degerlachei TaxID=229203 RepID=A0A1H2YVL8_9FLAO|nr:hypothetical protein [Flavobacterium degerlachei]SDX09097.1 hypothetical protein SAMN05444338_1076 [Flavobacterium degerlachei]